MEAPMRTLLIGVLALSVAAAQETATTAKLSGAALINHHLKAKWDEAGLKAAKRCEDMEFLRRAYLDIVGVIPALEEAEAFLADKSTSKRQQLVDRLVKDDRYSDHWADVWTGLLLGFDNDNREIGFKVKAGEDLKDLFAKNVAYDEFARKVITVTGAISQRPNIGMMRANEPKMPVEENGIAGYVYNISREAGRDFPMALAGKLTRTFMGVQIQCAQCHDHPFDKWTQEEFYGMASFFTEVNARRVSYGDAPKTEKKDEKKAEPEKKPATPPPQAQQQQPYYFDIKDQPRGRRGGDLSIPDSKTGPVKASFIETGKGAVDGELRRVTFAKYVTEPSNLQFAKMAVNRTWGHFFGAGIVNPVDDFNGKNKPTHPELLEELAKDFIAHKYDLHWLIKAITASDAYQLSSRLAAKDRDPGLEKWFGLSRVRGLSPEQILHSAVEATGYGEITGPLGGRLRRREMPKGQPGTPTGPAASERRTSLVLLQQLNQFRSNFADDEGGEITEFAGTIPGALLMMNGQVTGGAQLGRGISMSSGLKEILSKYSTPESRIKAIYLSVLTRVPTDKEQSRWKAHVGRGQGEAGYEDLQWTLLNTSEFLFNH
jgi:hypothetical protein